jgi:hypothetical protein
MQISKASTPFGRGRLLNPSWALGSVAVGILLAACSSSPDTLGTGGSGGGNSGTTGLVNIKFDASTSGNGGSGASREDGSVSLSGDAICGVQTSNMDHQPADLLLVLDRSGSMNWAIDSEQDCGSGGGNCVSRWRDVTTAMSSVLGSGLAGVRWGLKLFGSLSGPSGGDSNWGCVVDNNIDVQVGDNTSAQLQSKIAATSPGSATPTRAAIEVATAYLKGLSDGYPRYILLATDGQPNCPQGSTADTYNTSDLNPTVQAIAAAAAASIKTYVVGISTTPGNLTDMAKAGGTDNYYSATSPADLTNALKTIAGQVANCTFTMSGAPPDPNNVGVYLDKNLVPNASTDGWTYGSGNSVVFNGKYCDGIKNGTYTSVEVRFGCPGESGPPSIIP